MGQAGQQICRQEFVTWMRFLFSPPFEPHSTWWMEETAASGGADPPSIHSRIAHPRKLDWDGKEVSLLLLLFCKWLISKAFQTSHKLIVVSLQK